MSEYVYTYIALTIIIFIVCIILVIFAPKSKNFFKKIELETSGVVFDVLENKEILNDTYDNLQIFEDECEYEEVVDEETGNEKLNWLDWPDQSIIKGDIKFLPIFLFSRINETNLFRFKKLFDAISEMKFVQSIFFIKISPDSKFVKHCGWNEMTQNSLRYIYCFNAYALDENQSGVWVNGECKKLIQGSSYVFDADKEHSIYNYTQNYVIYLIIDFKRPDDIPFGYSENNIGNKKIEEIQKLVVGK